MAIRVWRGLPWPGARMDVESNKTSRPWHGLPTDQLPPTYWILERQKESFYAKVAELQDSKPSNSKFLTREDQEKPIKKFEDS